MLFNRRAYRTDFDEQEQTLYIEPRLRDLSSIEDVQDYADRFWSQVSDIVYQKEQRWQEIARKRGSETLKNDTLTAEHIPHSYVVRLGKHTPANALQILQEEYQERISSDKSNSEKARNRFDTLESLWDEGRFTLEDVGNSLESDQDSSS